MRWLLSQIPLKIFNQKVHSITMLEHVSHYFLLLINCDERLSIVLTTKKKTRNILYTVMEVMDVSKRDIQNG
jgi:hypothetical protein